MPVKKILTTPNKVLESPTEKVRKIDSEVKSLIKDLIDTLLVAEDPEGAGIAATQIGSNKRVCVVRRFFPDVEDPEIIRSKEYVLINPKIISKSKETEIEIEGCLSVPDVCGKVKRHKKIKIKATDENNKTVRMTETGYMARVIQHELDHLDGVLFISRVIGDTYKGSEVEKEDPK